MLAELRRVKPDVMIEFRQPYIGPLMRKYGNMFRAGDAPNAAVDNRVRTVDRRGPFGRTQERREAAQRRRLAGPVRPPKRYRFALLYSKGKVIDGRQTTANLVSQ